MRTYLYSAFVRTFSDSGYGRRPSGAMQVQVRAPDPWQARQILEGQYGSENVTSHPSLVSGSDKEGW